MSIVALPRRAETRIPTLARPRTVRQHAAPKPLVARWTKRSTSTKLAAIAISTMVVLLAGNSYAAQRQVEIHQLQTNLLQNQSQYAYQISALTNAAAPARVASQAGHLHLVVPTLVTQISAVPLNVRLPHHGILMA